MAKLDIKIGAKAIAIKSYYHRFEDGEEIKFVGYGAFDIEDDYCEYIFEGVRSDTGEVGRQFLEADEFTLVEG